MLTIQLLFLNGTARADTFGQLELLCRDQAALGLSSSSSFNSMVRSASSTKLRLGDQSVCRSAS